MPLYWDFGCSVCGDLPVLQESWQYHFIVNSADSSCRLVTDYKWCQDCGGIVQAVRPMQFSDVFLEKRRLEYEIEAYGKKWFKSLTIKKYINNLVGKLKEQVCLLSIMQQRDIVTSCCLCGGLKVFSVEDGDSHQGCGGTIYYTSENHDPNIRFRMPTPKIINCECKFSDQRKIDDNLLGIIEPLYKEYAGLLFGKLILALSHKINVYKEMRLLCDIVTSHMINVELLIDYLNQIIRECSLWNLDTTEVVNLVNRKLLDFQIDNLCQKPEDEQVVLKDGLLFYVFKIFCYNCVYTITTNAKNKKLVKKASHLPTIYYNSNKD